MKTLHGLEIEAARCDSGGTISYRCFAPEHEWEENGCVFLDRRLAGYVEHDLDSDTWCPADEGGHPYAPDGSTFYTRVPAAQRACFLHLEQAVMFLAMAWTRDNPQSPAIGFGLVAA